jgi:acyl-CoA synthetase (NDP forming)
VTVDALFKQAGVIRTDTLGEFFDVATLLANQPRPKGNRVAILTNGGGPGILCADACEADGLVVPQVPDDIKAKLAEFLPADAGLNNPVDMIAAAPGESYRKALKLLAEWDGIDAIIILYVPVLVTNSEEIAAGVRAAASRSSATSRCSRSSSRARARRTRSRPKASRSRRIRSRKTPPGLSPTPSATASGPRPPKAWCRSTRTSASEGKALIADVLVRSRSPAGREVPLAPPRRSRQAARRYGVPMAAWRLADHP